MATGRRARRAAGKIRSSVTPGGKRKPPPKKRVDPVSYDGDGDRKITNPLTGADEIPWDAATETPDQAIARFFAGRQGLSTPTAPTQASTLDARTAPKWPRRRNGDLTPISDLSDGDLGNLLKEWEEVAATMDREDVNRLLSNLRRESTNRKKGRRKKTSTGVADDAIERAASELHDAWRAGRLLPDGTYEPRMKDDGKGGEVDIANTPFKDLPEKWQKENRESAASAVEAILSNPDGNDEQHADAVHQAWMERNGSWAPAEQMVPYSELPESEKQKDRDVVNVAKMAIAQAEQDTPEAAMEQLQSLLPEYTPRPGVWRGPAKDSYFFDGAPAEERFRTEYINADIIDVKAVGGYDEDGYIVSGMYHDGFDSAQLPDSAEVHSSVEDAMKWLEDVNDRIEAGDDPYDPEWEDPDYNQITGGLIRDIEAETINTSDVMAEIEQLMKEKWFDRRFKDNLEHNIQLANDRLSELAVLRDDLERRYYSEFPDFDTAFYMSENDFARMMFDRGQVDSLAEGRQLHRDIMISWDQFSADIERLGEIRGRIEADRDRFLEKQQSLTEQ